MQKQVLKAFINGVVQFEGYGGLGCILLAILLLIYHHTVTCDVLQYFMGYHFQN